MLHSVTLGQILSIHNQYCLYICNTSAILCSTESWKMDRMSDGTALPVLYPLKIKVCSFILSSLSSSSSSFTFNFSFRYQSFHYCIRLFSMAQNVLAIFCSSSSLFSVSTDLILLYVLSMDYVPFFSISIFQGFSFFFPTIT